MKNNFKVALVLVSLVFLQLAPVQFVQAATGTINATNKYAWSQNIGWLNFNVTASNVVVNDTSLTGYIWTANHGWINLNPPGGGVTNNTSGVLGGSAWGENTGWISFSGVSIDSNGFFHGNATGTVTGTISFNCANTASCGSSDFKVQTDWIPEAISGGSSPQKQEAIENTNPPAEETPVEEPVDPVPGPDEEEVVVEEPVVEPETPVESVPGPVEEVVVEPSTPEPEQEQAPGDNQPPPTPEDPTQEETSNLEQILEQIIDSGIQENLPPGFTKPELSPSETGIETTSQSDGRSFTIEVEDQVTENTLLITGLATTDQDRIEFTGSTSEPNSTITLIFDNNITVVVTSDANGFWQTFVSANQLGIETGQSTSIQIDAIAAKGDLRSDKVSVGFVELSLPAEGEDIVAEFESIVEESALLTSIKSLQKQAVIIIEEKEAVIQKTLTVTAPVIIVSSAPLWGYLPYIPTLIYHFISHLIGLIGRKKQEDERLFGQVYNSITKKPLGLAVLRIYAVGSDPGPNKLVSTKVTDKSGRYDLLLPPGNYKIEVKKPLYNFPSSIIKSASDGEHAVIYSFDNGLVIDENNTVNIPDIPVDPLNAQRHFELANIFKKFWIKFQHIGHVLAIPVLFVGALASLVTVAAVPESLENWILAVLYIFLFILQLKLRPKLEKAWGVVYDLATSAALPLTTIQLIDPEYGKVMKSRLTDYQGRFAFLPEPGKYIVKANKPGYEQADVVESPDKEHAPIHGEVSIQKEGQRIDGDVAMHQL